MAKRKSESKESQSGPVKKKRATKTDTQATKDKVSKLRARLARLDRDLLDSINKRAGMAASLGVWRLVFDSLSFGKRRDGDPCAATI